jgi:hypothetical protein
MNGQNGVFNHDITPSLNLERICRNISKNGVLK